MRVFQKRHATVWLLCFLGAFAGMASGDSPSFTGVDLYTLTLPSGLTYPSVPLYNATESGQVGGFATDSTSYHEAILWNSAGVPTSLAPTSLSGYITSVIEGIGGGQEVGSAGGPATGLTSTNSDVHAMLWNGTAASAIDIHPTNLAGFTSSIAYGTDGTNQVGVGVGSDSNNHALLWSGSASTVVNLQPTNYQASGAYGVSGSQQVGVVDGQPNRSPVEAYAALWSGTAASFINLAPPSNPYELGSAALGIGGGQEVGYAGLDVQGNPTAHAMLWTGTAASYVDLNPSGAIGSTALATNGSQQVGYINVNGAHGQIPNAVIWAGTATSAINLQPLLPSYLLTSTAYSIDAAGDVFGTAGDSSGNYHAVAWLAPPFTATANLPGGSSQDASVGGRSPSGGSIQVNFPSATAGTLTNVSSLSTLQQLEQQTAPVNFSLPTDDSLVQTWDITFSGSFTGPATVVFQYDPTELAAGIDPSTLEIEHFENGQWVAIPGTVDPTTDTITIQTDSFSPFTLAVTPEPASVGFLAVVAFASLGRRRR